MDNKKQSKKKIAYRARHRLRSIHRDHQNLFKQQQRQDICSFPLIANERCGSWYIKNNSAVAHCYFKSTDGHVGTWNMSLKRLNLPLVDLLSQSGGCRLVDSSVRKILPDSFSRTIPIWACVMNRFIERYRREEGKDAPGFWDTKLYTPSCIVSQEEHLQICNLMDARVECLFQSQAIVNPQRLVDTMTKPIRAIWISNGNEGLEEIYFGLDKYFVIVCWNPSTYGSSITKNRIHWIDDDESSRNECGFYYTPGAADDQESWARHLTPELFWKYEQKLVDPSLNDDETDALIDSLVEQAKLMQDDDGDDDDEDCMADQIGNLNLWIGSRRAGRPPTCWDSFDAILNVTNAEYPENRAIYFYLQLPVAEGKRDKTELERWMAVGLVFLIRYLQNGRKVLVHCAQGKDRSVGLVLALVVLSCRLVFPLRLHPDFELWDLDSLGQKIKQSDKAKDSNKEDSSYYLQSGLLKSLVNGLLVDSGRDLFLEWVHSQLGKTTSEPVTNKENLRIALHLIRQDREVADPTRSTMQKLNRFFMSCSLYR